MFILTEQIRNLGDGPLTAKRVARNLHIPVEQAAAGLDRLAAMGEYVHGGVIDGPGAYWPAPDAARTSWHPAQQR